MCAQIVIDAGTTKFNASPTSIGINKNHVQSTHYWEPYKDQVLSATSALKTNWGSSEHGANSFLYRIGHGPTDGRFDQPNSYGYHYEDWFEVDGKQQGTYPHEDIKWGLNEAATMGAVPSMVVNIGTSRGADEAGRLAAYCNRASNSQRAAKNAARANNPYNVKYWEMGNEISWDSVRGWFSDSATYAQKAALHAAQVRANSDIAVKIGFVAATNCSFFSNWDQAFNDPFYTTKRIIQNSTASGVQQVDALILHCYPAWPVCNNRPNHNDSDYNGIMAMASWLDKRLAGAYDAINQYSSKPMEIWNTEYHCNSGSFAQTSSLMNALYMCDIQILGINKGWPINNGFCMWHKTDGTQNFNDNILFPNNDVSAHTPVYRWWAQVLSKNWGSATLNHTISGLPSRTHTGVDSKGNTTVPYLNITSSKSADGKKVYVWVLNRTISASVDLNFVFQNFTWNTTTPVTVYKMRGSSGYTSSSSNTTVTTQNWTPSTTGSTFAVEPASMMLFVFTGQATAPGNGLPPNPGDNQSNPPPAPSPSEVLQDPVPSKVPNLANIRETGANVIRVSAYWDLIEPSEGAFNWFDFEQALHNAKALQGRVVVSIARTPKWATGDSTTGGNLKNPTDFAKMDAFIQQLTDRTRNYVYGYEVWPEANTTAAYYPSVTDNPTRATYYGDLLTNYATKLRAKDSDCKIILGGLTYGGTSAVDLLTSLYDAGKRLDFDLVGLRPTIPSGAAWDTSGPAFLNSIRALMNSKLDDNKYIAVTAIGVGTEISSDQLQAQRVARTLALLQRPSWKIEFFCYAPLNDVPTDTYRTGLRTFNKQNKAAYTAFRTMCNVLYNKDYYRELTLGTGNFGLEFRDPLDRSTYVVWSSNEDLSTPVELPIRSNHYYLIIPQTAKFAEAVSPNRLLSFPLSKDVKIIQELDPVNVLPIDIPGQVVNVFDPTTTKPDAVNLNTSKYELSLNGLCFSGALLSWTNATDYAAARTAWFDLVGNRDYIAHFYLRWADRNDQLFLENKLSACKSEKNVPLVSLTFSGANDPTTRDIAQGLYDAELRAMATKFRDVAHPVFLSLIPHFNLSNNRACVANAVNMLASDYANAYRKIVDIFRAEGALNVAFVWTPYYFSNPNTPDNKAEHYYPGDDYVDWVGIGIYITSAWENSAALFGNTYALSRGVKPVMITEIAVTDPNNTGYNKAEALEDFFNAIESKYIRVKALVYNNKDNSTSDRLDLTNYPDLRNVFEDRTAHPRYIESGLTEP